MPENESAALHALFHDEWEAHLEFDPFFATVTGDRRYNDRLPEASEARYAREAQSLHSFLSRLSQIDCAGLSEADRLNCDVFRRLKQDVLPELPPIQVSILPIVVDTSQYREIERNVQKQILALSPTSKGYWMSVLDKLNYLRQASGIAKIPAAVEWAKDFLEENDGKLVIYAHHKRVGKELVAALAAFGADTISGDTPPRRRDELARCFRAEASPRVLVVTAAGGVGIDLFGEGRDCSNIIFVELEWRPSDFAQAWGRLHRFNQTNSVNAWILQARGTLDTYMTRRVDDKAAVIDEIMGDPPVIKEIVREWAKR